MCAGSPRVGSPKGVEGETADFPLESVTQTVGVARDTEDLVAIGPIIRLGGHADVAVRPPVEPPEELGRAKPQPARSSLALGRHVEGLGLEERIRLLPEANLARLSE